ncbi:DUF1835 domain-containing protein [Marinisporobacter balticus]|uniref:Uncharacterized protein DUF1835 n=1 Tax=Marinisporobacter balticus TaxID=2018667 RepID=A0A4R2KW19_9FIRM|nr:DUF1835 domain-containing protein [Marinisporobacter balticus]TCO74428.1 uncharacterized protein DUF1835 [Marinisporobacter balticus]
MKIHHIVAGLSAEGLLKYSIKKDNSEWYGQVIGIPDDFSVGPICYLGREVYDQRKRWLMDTLKITGALDDWEELQELYSAMIEKLNQINNKDKIVVWCGPNSIEVILFYQLCYKFRENSIFKVSLCELEEHKNIHISLTGQCEPEHILNLTSQIRPITDEEKIYCVKELKRLINENKMVRILEDDRVASKEEEFYDELILENAKKSYLKAPRVIGGTMGKSKYPVGDTFIDYRLRKLIDQGKLILRGNKESAMRFIEVKLP